MQEKIAGGGVVSRSKKWFEISSLKLSNGQLTEDRHIWEKEVTQHYSSKWGSGVARERKQILDYVFGNEGHGLNLSADSWAAAAEALKRPSKCDRYGLSVEFIRQLLQHQPVAAAKFLNKLTETSQWTTLIEVQGSIFGKKLKPPSRERN